MTYNELKRRDTERNVICNLIGVFLSFKMAARTINFCSSCSLGPGSGNGAKKIGERSRAGSGLRGRGDGGCLPLSSTRLARFAGRLFFALFPTKEPSPRLLFLWHISELALKYYFRPGYKYDKILLFQNECLNMLWRTESRDEARL